MTLGFELDYDSGPHSTAYREALAKLRLGIKTRRFRTYQGDPELAPKPRQVLGANSGSGQVLDNLGQVLDQVLSQKLVAPAALLEATREFQQWLTQMNFDLAWLP